MGVAAPRVHGVLDLLKMLVTGPSLLVNRYFEVEFYTKIDSKIHFIQQSDFCKSQSIHLINILIFILIYIINNIQRILNSNDDHCLIFKNTFIFENKGCG